MRCRCGNIAAVDAAASVARTIAPSAPAPNHVETLAYIYHGIFCVHSILQLLLSVGLAGSRHRSSGTSATPNGPDSILQLLLSVGRLLVSFPLAVPRVLLMWVACSAAFACALRSPRSLFSQLDLPFCDTEVGGDENNGAKCLKPKGYKIKIAIEKHNNRERPHVTPTSIIVCVNRQPVLHHHL